ncbi:MAG: glycogen debranching enzyme N-terminal domain-containing protein, partial [Acidobacteriota bacterium]|nr:glycogen debranching enzyme N-terminal domain-containing protein [Acidobacteriota bacterium]
MISFNMSFNTSFNTSFNQEECTDLSTALEREWLETNGIGGFASSTITGINTRRYHGLLVAATRPPVGRMVLLSKFEETLIIHGDRYDLSANQYPGVVHPQGYLKLKGFRLDPYPIYTYQVNGIEIEKRIFMVHGENTVVVEYSVNPSVDCQLELRPLIAFRDYHSLTHANSALDSSVAIEPGIATVHPYRDLVALSIAHNGSEVAPTGQWYYNLLYQAEQERGLDDREDLFNPFVLHFDLRQRPTASLIASTAKHDVADIPRLRKSETDRRVAWRTVPLAAAADQFIVTRGELHTVIAGYHWFGDWGRDTMIALPGLLLTTGRTEVAKEVLLAFSQYVSQGMLPNRFPDAGEAPEYNTVDATLWFFDAVRALLESTGDYEFVKARLYAVLVDIIEWHMRGTRYGIHADSDGLLACGEPGVQLTWMDVKIGDWVVTPRTGKPVEIQALWHNALRVMEQLAGRFGDVANATIYAEIAGRARASFEDKFWNAAEGCLYDVVNGEERDGAIRPN